MARVMAAPGSMHRFVRASLLWSMVAGILVTGSSARACSCASIDIRSAIADHDGAFIGTFVGRDTVDERLVAITFEVERVLKGEFGPTAIVRTYADGASCGIEFLGGPKTGLLLDRASDGVWESSLCAQVPANELIAFAPNASGPDPAVDPIGPSSSLPWWLFGAVIVLIVGGVVFFGARARRAAA